MFSKIPFFSIVLLSLMNCNGQKTANSGSSAPTEVSDSGEISLKTGESRLLKDSGIKITFKSVSQDSRCPEGVNCVWAGVAVAELELSGTSSKPVNVSLATMTLPQQNLSKTAVFEGYKIELKNVLPYPKKGVEKGDYSIEISVYKIAENRDENTEITTE